MHASLDQDFKGDGLPVRATARRRWAAMPIRERLRKVRNFRHLLAERAESLAIAAAEVSQRPVAEKLVSEILPLADACRWLERHAARALATRYFGSRGRPLWLHGASFEVQRKPFGMVLVIGPANYPLFLPAVHALHALVAGNAVLLKPAPGAFGVACAFAKLARLAGLESGLAYNPSGEHRGCAARHRSGRGQGGIHRFVGKWSRRSLRACQKQHARRDGAFRRRRSPRPCGCRCLAGHPRLVLRRPVEWRSDLHGAAKDHRGRSPGERSSRAHVPGRPYRLIG